MPKLIIKLKKMIDAKKVFLERYDPSMSPKLLFFSQQV